MMYYLIAVKLKGGGITGPAFNRVELECATFKQASAAQEICERQGYTCSILAQVRARRVS